MPTRFYLFAREPGLGPIASLARRAAERFGEAPPTLLISGPDLLEEAREFAAVLGAPSRIVPELGPGDADQEVLCAALDREAGAVGESCVAVVLSPGNARRFTAALLELPEDAGALPVESGAVILIDWPVNGGRAWLVAVDPDWCPPRAFGTLGARENYPGGPS